MRNQKKPKGWRTWPRWTLATIMILGAAIRFYGITDLGLTHWDEGPYAATGRILAYRPSFAFQALGSIVLYAPPLFPILVGFSQKILGFSDWATIAVSAASGTLTIYAMYILGKKLYGVKVGLLSALFVAVSPYHVIYSRMTLTDVTFLLFFLTALAFFYDALIGNCPTRRFILAGIAAGLAMNTKYSGPLVLAICLFAGLLLLGRRLLLDRWQTASFDECPFDLRSTITRMAFFLLTGIVLYLPWFIVVAVYFGYDRLAKHQVGYTALSTGVFVATSPVLMLQYFVRWTSPSLLLFGLIGLTIALAKRKTSDIFLVTYLSFSSLGVMLYLSYPRLALPLLPALSLLAGNGIIGLWEGSRRKTLKVAILTVVSLTALDLLRGSVSLLPVKTDGYRRAAQIVERLPKEAPVFQKMQVNFNFYTLRPWPLEDRPKVRQVLVRHGLKYFVFDQTLTWTTFTEQLFEQNRDRLKLHAKLPNPTYEIVYLQPASLAKMKRLYNNNIPDEYRYIFVYATDEPLLLPK